jgi:hypothetical protein
MRHCTYFSALTAKALNRDVFKTVYYSSVIHDTSVSSFMCSMFVFCMKYILPHLDFVHLPIRSHQYIVPGSSSFFYVSVQKTILSHVTFMKHHHDHHTQIFFRSSQLILFQYHCISRTTKPPAITASLNLKSPKPLATFPRIDMAASNRLTRIAPAYQWVPKISTLSVRLHAWM